MVAKWSFGTSRRDSGSFDATNTPGPGAYDSQSFRDPVRLSKFGKDRRIQRPNSSYYSPGPGTYKSSATKESPAWKIAGKPRTPKSERSPGPQSYSPEKATRRAPRYVIQGKYENTAFLKFSPGPGAYTPKKITSTSPSRSFDKEKKSASFIQDLDTPGPGEYLLNSKATFKSSPRAKFGRSIKKGMEEINPQFPGPGSYNVSRETSKKGFTITPRRERPKSAHIITPGPGTYDSGMNFFSTAYKIGNMKRVTVDTKEGPSCCDYSPFVNDQSPKYTMGTKYSMTERSFKKSPGPGEYTMNTWIGQGPKTSIRGRNFSASFDFTPGPGTYRNEEVRLTKKKISAAIFGTETRQSLVRKDSKLTPGPSDYGKQGQSNSSPKFSFSKSKRRTFDDFGLSPKRYKPRVAANETQATTSSGTMMKTY